MTGDGSVTLPWGDGEYRFRLAIGELRDLQDKCGCSVFTVFRRMNERSPMLDDLTETLRLGLIGGGMDPLRAKSKVAKFVSPPNIAPHLAIALMVLASALFPPTDDEVGKEQAAADPTPMSESNSASSSEPVRQWDGPLGSSTAPVFGNSPQPSMAGTDATVQARANGQTR